MRYLVKARLKPGKQKALLQAIQDGALGRGSVAGDEYIYDLQQARLGEDGTAHWVETCFCATPLEEERPYWEKYFELLKIQDAHNRKIASTKMESNRGRVRIAIAPGGWKNGYGSPANPFCRN
jgi:hypothetical protein